MVLVALTQRVRTLVCLAPEQNILVPPLVMRMLRVRALVPIDNSLTVTSTPTCRVDQTSTPTCRVDHTSNTARMGWKRGAKHETTRSYTETVRVCGLAQCSSTSLHACMNTDQSRYEHTRRIRRHSVAAAIPPIHRRISRRTRLQPAAVGSPLHVGRPTGVFHHHHGGS